MMKFTYDPRYNIAYIRFQPKSRGVESIKVSYELIVDMTLTARSMVLNY